MSSSSASAASAAPSGTLRFRRPRPSPSTAARNAMEEKETMSIFPPAIFTDATYSRGVLLVPNDNFAPPSSQRPAGDDGASCEEDHPRLEEVAVRVPRDYFSRLPQAVGSEGGGARGDVGVGERPPKLTDDEAARWNDGMAAEAAARRRSPMNAVRLLGTITLMFEEKKGAKPPSSLLSRSKAYCDKHKDRHTKGSFRRQPEKTYNKCNKAFSKKCALGEALSEMGLDVDANEISKLSIDVRRRLERRADRIWAHWTDVKKSPPMEECWDPVDGGFVREALGVVAPETDDGGEFFVPVPCLLTWAKSARVTDIYAGRTRSLYGGLRRIPTDATSVLESLANLSCPKALYKIPLITPYAVASRRTSQRSGEDVSWRVRIGVYANRLLPEVLTAGTLHCVMSALDEGSYIISEPLHVPPMRGTPVFQSAKYPVVRMPGTKIDPSTIIDVDSDDSMCGEEKKEEAEAPMDPAVIGSTRLSTTISPFTPRGYLKLIENTGNDVSMYPELVRSLSSYLKLDLMLHQRHALCWMTQMERLPGFGINSIIWEERTFLDGGRYYYSPALGQIRLNRPPVTVGGCVADEMGLGKTLQMLSLIASSLDDLKREARSGGCRKTHATLIIVPPALVMQWCSEIKKSCGDALHVGVMDVNGSSTPDVRSGGSGDDIVVTTYSALEHSNTSKFLASRSWGRVVLDEQQEIRSSTTKIAQNCEGLDCHRRWMLSGTPIFEGIQDLRGELNFLRLVPYAAKHEDGFFDFSIMSHWAQQSEHGLETLRVLGLLILRRSKGMTICRTGQSIMEQRKLTVELIGVAQSASERALYCWFEYLVSQELQRTNEASDTKKNLQSRALCLRLLREICFSAVMINGGMGVASQMKVLNALYRRILAREEKQKEQTHRHKKKKAESIRVMSPAEALRYLSQAERKANVGDEFISDQQFSRGQGATSRVRAAEDIEDQVKRAHDHVSEASKKEKDARSKRARSHWHLALEHITTGALCESLYDVSPKVMFLWKLRSLCIKRGDGGGRSIGIAPFLFRGWRPRLSFAEDLLATNPSFHWARPGCLLLENIPPQVSIDDVREALYEASKIEPRTRMNLKALCKRLEKVKGEPNKARIQTQIVETENQLPEAVKYDQQLRQPSVMASPLLSATTENWKAYVQVSDCEDIIRQAKSRTGISLKSSDAVPHVQSAREKAQEQFIQADAEQNVHPCAANIKKKADAQKALEIAKLGLTIKSESTPFDSSIIVLLSRASRSLRGPAPRSKSALLEGSYANIAHATESLEQALTRLQHGQSTLNRLMPALSRGVPQDGQKSAYDTLECLRRNEFGGNHCLCPICQMTFGENAGEDPKEVGKIVAMLFCGHFYCIKCIDHHIHVEISRNRVLNCPICRAGFTPGSDVMHIDHLADDDEEVMIKRQEAKTKVREASDILSTSEGVLPPELWNSLFLSIDLPAHVSTSPHHRHTALRRDVLAHFRAATGMEIDCARSSQLAVVEDDAHAGMSTKIQALLRDLPLGEHAVVFSSSKEGVLHLSAVIKSKGINCFGLYTGQDTTVTEYAVSSWTSAAVDSFKAGPVLVIQAGAAASGLTLTAASKMFLMEPFSRQEEEQQAYARCHRYGQKKDVHVKVYFAPVSVESRLLRWRKRSLDENMAAAGDGTNYVFSQLFGEGEDSDVDDGCDETMDVKDGEEYKHEEDDDKVDGDGEVDSPELAEDNLRTQFLLGLIDEDGNPTGEAPNNGGYPHAAEARASARRFLLD